MKRTAPVLVLLGCLFFGGCASTGPNILNVQASPKGMSAKNIENRDIFLHRWLGFGDVAIRPLGTSQTFEAQVMLINKSSRDLAIDYTFRWYDAYGFEVAGISAWIPCQIAATGTKALTSCAPNAEVAGFRLLVRRSKNLSSQK